MTDLPSPFRPQPVATNFVLCYLRPLAIPVSRETMAGAEGFEPPSSVLETDSLAIELTPLSLGEFQTRPLTVRDYFTSRCAVCLRHLRQNLLNSNRSVVVLRFLVVE